MRQGLENGIAFVSSLGVASADTCLSIILPQEAHFCDMPVRQISKKESLMTANNFCMQNYLSDRLRKHS